MTETEAFEAFIAKWNAEKKDAGLTMTDDEHDCAEEAWNAALAWLRSQGAPVAWMSDDGAIEESHKPWMDTEVNPAWHPLFLAPQPAIPDGWQDIETAPKDGTRILVFAVSEDDPYDRPDTIAETWWGDEGGTENK